MARKKKEACVYVIGNRRGQCKIGRSSAIDSRREQLQSANPEELLLYMYIPTKHNAIIEKNLHFLFRKKNIHGEWFQLEPNDIERIKQLVPLLIGD